MLDHLRRHIADPFPLEVTMKHQIGPTAKIHGNLDQPMRDKAMGAFRAGTCRVLIATDIAARGLDISDIEHVVNYDFPHHAEDYVHRVGRTARVEASGTATSLITPADQRYVRALRRLIGERLPQPTRLESYDPSKARDDRPGRSGRKRGPRGRPRRRRGGRAARQKA